MISTLKEIEKLETRKQILSECIARAPQYKSRIKSCVSPPSKPSPPNDTIKPIPNYNEKEYVKKAKEEETSLSGFRQGCIVIGLWMAGSVIGLILCWIPWLLAILSWPFSIFYTRKRAYQIYLTECQELERHNNKIRNWIAEYNRKSAEYSHRLEEYQQQQQLLPQKLVFVDNLVTSMQKEQKDIDEKLRLAYITVNAPFFARGFIPVHAMLLYISNKQASTYEDALQLFDEEITAGKINLSLDEAKRYRKFPDKSMMHVMEQILLCEEKADRIYDKLDQYFTNDNFSTDYAKFQDTVIPT